MADGILFARLVWLKVVENLIQFFGGGNAVGNNDLRDRRRLRRLGRLLAPRASLALQRMDGQVVWP